MLHNSYFVSEKMGHVAFISEDNIKKECRKRVFQWIKCRGKRPRDVISIISIIENLFSLVDNLLSLGKSSVIKC